MELVRKSIYDVLKENLALAKRKTFLHRYAFAGEHHGEKEIAEAFTNMMNKLNDEFFEEPLTGLLLLYPNYFIHIVDGCEDVIIRHLQILTDEYSALTGETKILFFYHHINQRFFDVWAIRFAKPPILLQKIDPGADFEELKRHLEICVKKMYSLCMELRDVDSENVEPVKIKEIEPYMSEYLPEYILLSFLLTSIHTFPIHYILKYQDFVLDTRYQLEQVWPVKADYVPYNIFEKEMNPIQNLPTAVTPITK